VSPLRIVLAVVAGFVLMMVAGMVVGPFGIGEILVGWLLGSLIVAAAMRRGGRRRS